jgi:membrane-bound acyltransferase YfiQ involved in biofilm formation
MRGNAWKAALIAIVFCYPVASLIGRLITYIGLKAQSDPSSADQLQMFHLGDTFFRIIAVLGWLIAFISGMESTRAEDQLERQLGRFAFVVVLVATVIYVAAFFLGRGVLGVKPV